MNYISRILNQPQAGIHQVLFVCNVCMHVCVSACVSVPVSLPPRALIANGVTWRVMDLCDWLKFIHMPSIKLMDAPLVPQRVVNARQC